MINNNHLGFFRMGNINHKFFNSINNTNPHTSNSWDGEVHNVYDRRLFLKCNISQKKIL